jgi:hypothetical protein
MVGKLVHKFKNRVLYIAQNIKDLNLELLILFFLQPSGLIVVVIDFDFFVWLGCGTSEHTESVNRFFDPLIETNQMWDKEW